MDFGAGCFHGIRNPAAHEDGLLCSDKVALARLAAFSVPACWIDECTVETEPTPASGVTGEPSRLASPQP
jgi:hypothetical protein